MTLLTEAKDQLYEHIADIEAPPVDILTVCTEANWFYRTKHIAQKRILCVVTPHTKLIPPFGIYAAASIIMKIQLLSISPVEQHYGRTMWQTLPPKWNKKLPCSLLLHCWHKKECTIYHCLCFRIAV